MAAVGMMKWKSAKYGDVATPATTVVGFLGLEETGKGVEFPGYGGDAEIGITSCQIGTWDVKGAVILSDLTTALALGAASGVQGLAVTYVNSAGADKVRKYVSGVIFGLPAPVQFHNRNAGAASTAYRVPFDMVFGTTQTIATAITEA